jgi:hypothetical protein
MQIIIEPHTLQRAIERGATETEITDVLTHGVEIVAKQGRLAKSKVFLFQQIRNSKYYEQKRIDVFYLIENDKIITVTVYVFYGTF